jgi:hypothetical protein
MEEFAHGVLRSALNPKPITAIHRAAKAVVGAALVLFLGYVAAVAVSETWDWSAFSEPMLIKLEQWPIVFRVHMVTGGLALLLAPLAIALRRTIWHRFAGQAAAVDVAVAAITAIPVALESPVTCAAAAGFSAQALVWLAMLGLGLWNIRRGRVEAHRVCMLALTAVTSGALVFRLLLSLWSLSGDRASFRLFYSCDAWVAWLLPLAVTLSWLARERRIAAKAA